MASGASSSSSIRLASRPLDSRKFPPGRSIRFWDASALYKQARVRTGKDLVASEKQTFVADLERQHGQRLRRFLASRLRYGAADVQDLVQEVFLRMLRIDRHETIRSSESYLYMVAFHVLHQHLLRRAAAPEAVEITALINEMEAAPADDPLKQAETQQQLQALQGALRELSPKAQAVLILHRRDGYSLDEIAAQLGFSRANAAKYLSKALRHCRQHLQDRK
jgi:RNA polymerase sigma factor (sigma-70 family)